MNRIIQKPTAISSLYTIFVILIPYFSKFASGVSGLQLSDIILVCFWVCALVQIRDIRLDKNMLIIPLLTFIIISTIDMLFVNNQSELFDVCVRLARFAFYILSVAVLSSALFNVDKAMKWIEVIGYVFTGYLFLQYISYFVFGYTLRGNFGILNLYISEYESVDYALVYSSHFFRPTSLLLEPAHYARYMLLALAVSLYNPRHTKFMMTAVVFTIGIIASTSSIGLLLVILIWFYYLFGSKKKVQKKRLGKIALTTVVLMPVIYLILVRTNTITNVIDRLLYFGEYSIYISRLSGYLNFFSEGIWRILFGYGFGYYSGLWQSGLVIVLYGTGVIGASVLIVNLISLYRHSRSALVRTVLLTYGGLLLGDDTLLSVITILYLSFVVCRKTIEREECNEGSLLIG